MCAQLGLPVDQITSDKGPHLLLCAALLAAPSALSWGFYRAAAAVMDNLDRRAEAARHSPAAVLTAGSGLPSGRNGSSSDEQGSDLQKGGDALLLRMSYSALPLVWAGGLRFLGYACAWGGVKGRSRPPRTPSCCSRLDWN